MYVVKISTFRPAPVVVVDDHIRPIKTHHRTQLLVCTSSSLPAQQTSTSSQTACDQKSHLLATPRLAAVLQRFAAKARASGNTLPLLLGAAPVSLIPPTVWDQLGANYVFMAGFCGWFLAQFLKIFTRWFKTGVFSLKAFVDSGGMPSSHSALCSAVTTAVALQQGLSSSLFAVCTCFSAIVMYDAMGVRRHAGLQAEVLNAVVEDLLEGHPMSEKKLKEVLGHTPRQVVCGAILGLLVGLAYPRPF